MPTPTLPILFPGPSPATGFLVASFCGHRYIGGFADRPNLMSLVPGRRCIVINGEVACSFRKKGGDRVFFCTQVL